MAIEEKDKQSQEQLVMPDFYDDFNKGGEAARTQYITRRKEISEQTPDLSGYDPEKHGFITSYLKEIHPAPTPKYTPEQEKRIKMWSGIGDSLRTVIELGGAAKGAYVRNADPNDSATNKTSTRLKAMEDEYIKNLDKYNQMRYNAGLQDRQEYLKGARSRQAQELIMLDKDFDYGEKVRKGNLDVARYEQDRLDKKNYQEKSLGIQERKVRATENRSPTGSGSSAGMVDLSDGTNTYSLPSATWNSAAQQIYGLMTSSGRLPKLTQEKKSALGLPKDVPITSPAAIRAYIEQSGHLFTSAEWEIIKNYARSQRVYITNEGGNENEDPNDPLGLGIKSATDNNPLGI